MIKESIKLYDILDDNDKIVDLELLLYYAQFCVYKNGNKKKNMKKLKKIIRSKKKDGEST